MVVVLVEGLYGFPAWRQFVDDGDVEVAVDGHGERPGYGRGRHDEDVRRILAFAPEPGTLCHAEAVLFVDDGHAEAVELHFVFEEGVCADDDVDGAVHQSVEYLPASLSFYDACQQFYAQVHPFQEVPEGLKVLFGKDFRRCHHARLVTVVDGDEHGHQGDKRLARTHIALQQAVHLPSASHIGTYLVHHPFLCSGEFKGQVVGIEPVELCSDAVEDVPRYLRRWSLAYRRMLSCT